MNLIFQLTTSQGGRRQRSKQTHATVIFQLTTSQGGRHSQAWRNPLAMYLSTHDLTRRSTMTHEETYVNMCLSTHDLTRRSTFPNFDIWVDRATFNSRPHKEVDDVSLLIYSTLLIFQLTTSQGGRRSYACLYFLSTNLSTHDLTRRSTGIIMN